MSQTRRSITCSCLSGVGIPGLVAVLALGFIAGCATVDVPPPWPAAAAEASPRSSAQAPVTTSTAVSQRYPRTVARAPSPRQTPGPTSPAVSVPSRGMSPATVPVARDEPSPTIFYAPSEAVATHNETLSDPRRVLQAEPGPALSLDFKPNPAWKRAVIPPNSRPTTVGQVGPPATPGFIIGPGDTVAITVLGRPELAATGNIGNDGMVTAALLGPVAIAGLSPAQAGEKLARAYKDQQYLVNPQVTVTLSEYQSQQLTVLGEVRNPGRFPMRTRLSVLDGLALSGGINELGSSMAYILRPEDSVVTRYEVDLDALIQAGAGQQYFELLPGDSLVVPKAEVFYIYGEVKSPNAYKLKPGITVIQALSLAGGLTDKGSDRRIDIRRKDSSGRLVSMGAVLNDPLRADDVIYVRERLF